MGDPKLNDLSAEIVERLLSEEIGLSEALGVPTEASERLRQQAVAQFQAGQHRRCVIALEAALQLGDLTPYDAVMLSRCYDALDDPGSAERWAGVAQELLEAWESILEAREERA